MRRFSLLPTLLLSVALTFSLAACDSNDDDDDNGNGGGPGGDVGNVSVTVSGDVTDSFSGNAFFVVDEDEDAFNFAIGLFSGAITNPTSGQNVVLGRDGDRPSTGTYTIDSEETETEFYGGYSNYEESEGDISNALTIVADEGTLQITSSSASRVAGNFTFTGRVFDFDTPTDTTRTATVAGEFEADLIDAGNVPDLPRGF